MCVCVCVCVCREGVEALEQAKLMGKTPISGCLSAWDKLSGDCGFPPRPRTWFYLFWLWTQADFLSVSPPASVFSTVRLERQLLLLKNIACRITGSANDGRVIMGVTLNSGSSKQPAEGPGGWGPGERGLIIFFLFLSFYFLKYKRLTMLC